MSCWLAKYAESAVAPNMPSFPPTVVYPITSVPGIAASVAEVTHAADYIHAVLVEDRWQFVDLLFLEYDGGLVELHLYRIDLHFQTRVQQDSELHALLC